MDLSAQQSQLNETYNTANLQNMATGGGGALEELLSTMVPTIDTTIESVTDDLTTMSTTTVAPTIEYLTTSIIKNVAMKIAQNLTTSTPSTFYDSGSSDTTFQNLDPQNFSEFNSFPDNNTDSSHQRKYSVVPGSSEVMIIIAIVFVLLYIAAKYIGCTLSHCPIISKCLKNRGSDHYQNGIGGAHSSHTMHYGNRYRQEYSRRDNYAVYSRPATAFPRPMTAYPGIAGLSAGFQDPGFSYNSSFDMNDAAHCKVVVNEETEEMPTEQPPTYDSIVPSYTTQNRYTYSATRR